MYEVLDKHRKVDKESRVPHLKCGANYLQYPVEEKRVQQVLLLKIGDDYNNIMLVYIENG